MSRRLQVRFWPTQCCSDCLNGEKQVPSALIVEVASDILALCNVRVVIWTSKDLSRIMFLLLLSPNSLRNCWDTNRPQMNEPLDQRNKNMTYFIGAGDSQIIKYWHVEVGCYGNNETVAYKYHEILTAELIHFNRSAQKSYC